MDDDIGYRSQDEVVQFYMDLELQKIPLILPSATTAFTAWTET